jgi:hypothetical protein
MIRRLLIKFPLIAGKKGGGEGRGRERRVFCTQAAFLLRFMDKYLKTTLNFILLLGYWLHAKDPSHIY